VIAGHSIIVFHRDLRRVQSMGKADKAKRITRPAASAALGLALSRSGCGPGAGVSILPFAFGLNAFALSAIAVTFWHGGTKPGIFAAVLSALVRSYMFDP
jgi:hypothetical protein